MAKKIVAPSGWKVQQWSGHVMFFRVGASRIGRLDFVFIHKQGSKWRSVYHYTSSPGVSELSDTRKEAVSKAKRLMD